MAPRICIATSFDEPFRRIGAYAAMTIRHYARVHGLAAEIETRFELDRPPAWRRIKLIGELFDRGYDYVMWVDADALFCRFDVDVRSVIRPDADLYIVRHGALDSEFGQLANTGVMLLRNGDWSRRLLDDWWGMTAYVNHMLWDNAALLKLMGHNAFLREGPDRPNAALLKRTVFMPVAWNSLRWHPAEEPPIIKHFAGVSHAEREREMPLEAMAACFAALGDASPRRRTDGWRARLAGVLRARR